MDNIASLPGLPDSAGLAGFPIAGAGASGAFGALGLWSHQNPKLAVWGKPGLLGVAGLLFLVLAIIG